ncbi:hypothetical protein ACA348_10630 [Orientia tsutsugamushi]|uniref:hypothetical protein n=1 Tax=Orientia tsutsugamushi TaxID=784 RepID=UPI00352815DA
MFILYLKLTDMQRRDVAAFLHPSKRTNVIGALADKSLLTVSILTAVLILLFLTAE